MRTAGAVIALAALTLAGCASQPKLACPAGQSELHTAQLFLSARTPTKLSDSDLRRFVDQEITPRFPEGVTIVDGGGLWKGDENQMIRDAAKVVLIVLPKADGAARVEAVRAAYRTRFKQETVVVTPPPSCMTL